jgi:hypothetical protein
MVIGDDKKGDGQSPPNGKPATTHPGQNDGRISAKNNAGMRSGASRPGPKKK